MIIISYQKNLLNNQKKNKNEMIYHNKCVVKIKI